MVRKVDYKILFIGIILLVVYALMIRNKTREGIITYHPDGSTSNDGGGEAPPPPPPPSDNTSTPPPPGSGNTTPPAGGNTTPPASGNTRSGTRNASRTVETKSTTSTTNTDKKVSSDDDDSDRTWIEWLLSLFGLTWSSEETYENYPTRSLSYDDVESERFARF